MTARRHRNPGDEDRDEARASAGREDPRHSAAWATRRVATWHACRAVIGSSRRENLSASFVEEVVGAISACPPADAGVEAAVGHDVFHVLQDWVRRNEAVNRGDGDLARSLAHRVRTLKAKLATVPWPNAWMAASGNPGDEDRDEARASSTPPPPGPRISVSCRRRGVRGPRIRFDASKIHFDGRDFYGSDWPEDVRVAAAAWIEVDFKWQLWAGPGVLRFSGRSKSDRADVVEFTAPEGYVLRFGGIQVNRTPLRQSRSRTRFARRAVLEVADVTEEIYLRLLPGGSFSGAEARWVYAESVGAGPQVPRNGAWVGRVGRHSAPGEWTARSLELELVTDAEAVAENLAVHNPGDEDRDEARASSGSGSASQILKVAVHQEALATHGTAAKVEVRHLGVMVGFLDYGQPRQPPKFVQEGSIRVVASDGGWLAVGTAAAPWMVCVVGSLTVDVSMGRGAPRFSGVIRDAGGSVIARADPDARGWLVLDEVTFLDKVVDVVYVRSAGPPPWPRPERHGKLPVMNGDEDRDEARASASSSEADLRHRVVAGDVNAAIELEQWLVQSGAFAAAVAGNSFRFPDPLAGAGGVVGSAEREAVHMVLLLVDNEGKSYKKKCVAERLALLYVVTGIDFEEPHKPLAGLLRAFVCWILDAIRTGRHALEFRQRQEVTSLRNGSLTDVDTKDGLVLLTARAALHRALSDSVSGYMDHHYGTQVPPRGSLS